jgi:hypothetical protein
MPPPTAAENHAIGPTTLPAYPFALARARSLLDLLAEAGVDLEKDVGPELLKRESSLRNALKAAAARALSPALFTRGCRSRGPKSIA